MKASCFTASFRTATISGIPPSSAAPAPSCAALRSTKSAASPETVTEDAHTSLRMQMNGWNTAYINIPQAAGLATERLSAHVGQRIRWARGMIQVLRTDNPLFAPGLSFLSGFATSTPWAIFSMLCRASSFSRRR
jgi:cellulose synthase/poly-beta-1,6-N-acetylglucosamine synthase-like glycosyltransferase